MAGLDYEVALTTALPAVSQPRISSLRLWLPFRVSPVHHRETPVIPKDRVRPAPSEVLSPSASVNHEEPPTPGESQPAGYVAPPGFLTLSTPCSPHGLPGLFHPGTAHGVPPFEALLLTRCRTPLSERRAPRGFLSTKKEETAPPGTHTPHKGRRRVWRLDQAPAPIAPLGFPAPRFLALSSEGRSHALASPLALSRPGRTLTEPLAPQGFRCLERSRSPSRPADLHAVSHLDHLLDALETPQSWAMGYPQRPDHVAAAPSSSSPCCRFPGQSLPRSHYR
jgi:hypothetical protein